MHTNGQAHESCIWFQGFYKQDIGELGGRRSYRESGHARTCEEADADGLTPMMQLTKVVCVSNSKVRRMQPTMEHLRQSSCT
jgi:hypothetical protein